MAKQFWINLPVKDISKSIEFYTGLGFTVNLQNDNNQARLTVGEQQVTVMLFQTSQFEKFTQLPISDTNQSVEVLFSVDAESREEVIELANKAVQAGGTIFAEPEESQGWMYGCGFADPDGHRWNVLYMDMSKIPKD